MTMDIEKWFQSFGLVPYTPSPDKDLFMFKFITTYLITMKDFSMESIRNFTTYDFVNLANGQIYNNWSFTSFEILLLRVYFQYIRVQWINANPNEDITTLVKSPCGLHLSLSSKFFVNDSGNTEWTVQTDLAEDLLNRNLLTSKFDEQSVTTRPRRTRRLSLSLMRNCQTMKMAVYEKCMIQQWIDVEVCEMCPDGRGRGIVAARAFEANEILVDYHARLISKTEMEEIQTDSRVNYLFCGPSGLFWDGSAESCVCHPQSRVLGRLVNFAKIHTFQCNAKPQLFQFQPPKCTVFNTIILVATRDIKPLEEVRFDYGDRTCLELFKSN